MCNKKVLVESAPFGYVGGRDLLDSNLIDEIAANDNMGEKRFASRNMSCANVIKDCVIGYLSGTFDLFHIGHLNLLKRAKAECDYLIVGVHPDATHKNKKALIAFEDRIEIVRACRYVDKAVPSFKEDCDAWEAYHYDKLFVGSDYKGTERFERYEEFFKDKGVQIVYFSYTQGVSSTQIRQAVFEKENKKDD